MQGKRAYLVLSIVLVLLLCVAQIFGSAALILPCLVLFLLLVGWSCSHNFTLPILLFFLPWSPVLRTSPTGYSFFTFGLVLVCAVSIIKKRFRFRKYPIVAGILLLFLTLISKLLEGYGLEFDYIAFMMLLVCFPVVKGEWTVKKYEFYQIAIFFALGVIIAALCALNLTIFPNIAKYIRVDAYSTITRRSGFYGDANFYTAQITAAMGGCLLAILREKKVGRIVFLAALLVLLLYSGFLSGSKSFVLVALCVAVLWVIAVMTQRGRTGLKIGALISLAAVLLLLTTTALFGDLLDIVATRFSYSKDIDSFTTGRTSLWMMYLEEMIGNIKVFFLGKGFTNVKVEGRGSHNTLIQMLFQFGFLGTPVLIYWIVSFFRGGRHKGQRVRLPRWEVLLMVIAVFAPWMAIDALFFDEFFLLQWYVFSAIEYLKADTVTAIAPVEESYG